MSVSDPANAIRPARASDASALAALSIEVWVGTYLRTGVNAFFADYVLSTFTTARTEALLAEPDSFTLVHENATGIDGFIRVARDRQAPVTTEADVEITTFYVQPRHHGKGTGTALLKAALARCRAADVPAVWLTTNAENIPGIAFYHAFGFTEIGQTHFRIGTEGYLNTVYHYALF